MKNKQTFKVTVTDKSLKTKIDRFENMNKAAQFVWMVSLKWNY